MLDEMTTAESQKLKDDFRERGYWVLGECVTPEGRAYDIRLPSGVENTIKVLEGDENV